MIVRQQCKVEGCTRLGELRQVQYGKTKWRNICWKHRRPNVGFKEYKLFDISKCEKCGIEDSCDRHRLGDPSRAYTRENVIVLCKACHADAHNHSWKDIKV